MELLFGLGSYVFPVILMGLCHRDPIARRAGLWALVLAPAIGGPIAFGMIGAPHTDARDLARGLVGSYLFAMLPPGGLWAAALAMCGARALAVIAPRLSGRSLLSLGTAGGALVGGAFMVLFTWVGRLASGHVDAGNTPLLVAGVVSGAVSGALAARLTTAAR
jgi:hypothetical protein